MASSEGKSDNSVEFLQKEHAKTLQGLHGEITRLQQKCAKLTFELTMGGGTKDQAACDQDTNSSTVVQMLEKELRSSQETESVLQSKVETLESQIALQKHEKHLLIQKHEDQINSKDNIVMSLHTQLEEKSNTVAQMVHKMHQMQKALQRGSLLSQQEQSLPLPPKEPPPSEGVYRVNRISRRVRKPINPTTTSSNSSLTQDDRIISSSVTGSLPAVQFHNSVPPVPPGNGRSLSHGATDHLLSSESPSFPPQVKRQPSPSVITGNSSVKHQFDFSLERDNESSKLQWHVLAQDVRNVNNPKKTVLPPIPIDDDDKLPPIVPLPSDNTKPRNTAHQRFHLAKTQGLTSAPPCPVRFANGYGGKGKKDPASIGESSPPSSGKQSTDKGLLMVKHETSKTMLNRLHHQQESK